MYIFVNIDVERYFKDNDIEKVVIGIMKKDNTSLELKEAWCIK